MLTIEAMAGSWLKKSPTPSTLLPLAEKMAVPKGKTYKIINFDIQENGHTQIELAYGAGTWFVFTRDWKLPEQEDLLTIPQLKLIYPWTPLVILSEAEPHLNKFLRAYNIETPTIMSMFLAQVGHESGGLRYREEIASGAAYEGRKDLGNMVKGDGVRFKG